MVQKSLCKKVFVKHSSLKVAIGPVLRLGSADTGQFDLVSLREAAGKNRRQIVGEMEINPSLAVEFLNVKIPLTNFARVLTGFYFFLTNSHFLGVIKFPIIALVILTGNFIADTILITAGMSESA